MKSVTSKKLHIILLVGLLITLFIMGIEIRVGYTQTNMQELKNLVEELERKLADAKDRQEKAYSVQMKLEEQEQKLASLTGSNKYKLQIIEIRADIKNIRTKIEAITKEKNDLEENLRLAKNLQTILSEERKIEKTGIKTQATSAQEKSSTQSRLVTTVKSSVKPVIADTEPQQGWLIEKIKLSSYFNDNERNEIMDSFYSGHQLNEEDLLKGAYQIYNRTGVTLHFIIHPKTGSAADLEVLLHQREDNPNSYFTYFTPMTLSQFKSERFSITVTK